MAQFMAGVVVFGFYLFVFCLIAWMKYSYDKDVAKTALEEFFNEKKL